MILLHYLTLRFLFDLLNVYIYLFTVIFWKRHHRMRDIEQDWVNLYSFFIKFDLWALYDNDIQLALSSFTLIESLT